MSATYQACTPALVHTYHRKHIDCCCAVLPESSDMSVSTLPSCGAQYLTAHGLLFAIQHHAERCRTMPPESRDISVCTLPSCVVVMPLRLHQVGQMYEYLSSKEGMALLVGQLIQASGAVSSKIKYRDR